MYKILKDGRPPVNYESSGFQHPEYHHRVLSGIITVDGPFYHHQFISLDWCLDLEQIQSLIQLETMKGEPKHNHY